MMQNWGMSAWMCVLLSACTATEGPLLELVAERPDGGAPGLDAGFGASGVKVGGRLQYQLTGELDGDVEADLFVVDLFNTTAAQVAALKRRGATVAAYISVGTYESFRPDASAFPRSAIGNSLDDYPGEAWLDFRDSTVVRLMRERLVLAQERGFDAVFPSAVNAYEYDSGHDLTATDQLAYNIWLSEQAHGLGLLSGFSGDWPHGEQLASVYDFAVHFGCIADDRCGELEPFQRRKLAVFDIEWEDNGASCDDARTLGIPVSLKRESLDAWVNFCP